MEEFLKAYLQRAESIVGERSPGEIQYDNAVVEALNQGRSIEEALGIAAARYPSEAIQWEPATLPDIAAHYDYLKEHMAILAKMRGRKK